MMRGKRMDKKTVCVGVMGAGAISDIYFENMINRFDNLYVKSVCAGHLASAQKKAEKYRISATTLEEMLADPEIKLVVNLTPAHAHYGIIKAALEHGKHVYTEKTLTDDLKKSEELVSLAREKGLYLGSAPETFLGGALQYAKKVIEEGLIGEINSFSISANRNNDMLLDAYAYMRQPGGGIVCDYGVYYCTALVTLLGSVKRVGSIVRTPYPTHINTMPGNPLEGQLMETPNESEVSAIMQMANGITGTFHINADSIFADQAFFYIYGTKGILILPDPNQFAGPVRLIRQTEEFWKHTEPEILWKPEEGEVNFRGIGPSEMAETILHGTPYRATAELACHVHEVLTAMLAGGEEGAFKDIFSDACKRDETGRF